MASLEAAAQGIGERRPISGAHIGPHPLHPHQRPGQRDPGWSPHSQRGRAVDPAGDDGREEGAAGSYSRRAIGSAVVGRQGQPPGAHRLERPQRAAAGRGSGPVRWADVDLELGVLTVSGQLDRQNRRTKPKTKKSARSLQLDETTVGPSPGLAGGSDPPPRARSQRLGGPRTSSRPPARGNPVDRHSFAKSLKRLCAEVDIDPPISPYELRHTAITMQADAGHSSWEIADWAGTSEAMISEVYRHRLQRVSTLGPVGLGGPGSNVDS